MKKIQNNINLILNLSESQATIAFADNGNGYNHEAYSNPNIFFELGFRASKEKGLGIGLYHIKQLVDKNGGSVAIDDKYSDGFKITITLNKM